MTPKLSGDAMELSLLVAKLAEADGVIPLKDHEGLWVRKIGDKWLLVCNGHAEVLKHGGVEVHPFHFYVEYRGWPAAVWDAYGGEFAAGELANQETFRSAVEAEIERVNRREIPK